MSEEVKVDFGLGFARKQVDLINGKFPLDKEALLMMDYIRSQIQLAADNILTHVENKLKVGQIQINTKFLEQGLFEVQAAKDRLCCAVIMPFHGKKAAAEPEKEVSAPKRQKKGEESPTGEQLGEAI